MWRLLREAWLRSYLCEDGCLVLFLTNKPAFHIVRLHLLIMQLYFLVLLFDQCYGPISHLRIYSSI